MKTARQILIATKKRKNIPLVKYLTIKDICEAMEEEIFKYAFAEKNGRRLCVKYNQFWENHWWEYLYDKGYELRSASEQHWNRQIDEVGRMCECYLLDRDLLEFDVGSY